MIELAKIEVTENMDVPGPKVFDVELKVQVLTEDEKNHLIEELSAAVAQVIVGKDKEDLNE